MVPLVYQEPTMTEISNMQNFSAGQSFTFFLAGTFRSWLVNVVTVAS